VRAASGLESARDYSDDFRMQITAIRTHTAEPVSLCAVETSDGLVGWGQLGLFRGGLSAEVLHAQIAPQLIGKPSDDIDGLCRRVVIRDYKWAGAHFSRALAGVETALRDLAGKRAGKPVCELLGGRCGPVPVYGSSMRRDLGPEAELERMRRLQGERGFQAFKIKIGERWGADRDAAPGRTERLIERMPLVLEPGTRLLADANSGFGVARAIEIGARLEQAGFWAFEEPTPCLEWERWIEVASALTIPVAGGEHASSEQELGRMLRFGAVDIVQPDLGYVGGVGPALRVAEMAAASKRGCLPHSANRSLQFVFTLHAIRAFPDPPPFAECSIEETPWATGIYDPQPVVEDGVVRLSGEPGWGVRIRESWIAQAEARETRG